MKWLRYTLSSLVLSSALALAGCGGGSAEPDPDASVDPIAQDEIVDLGDLIQQDQDAAAAAEMIGDPATLLAEGQKQGDKARGDVAAVLSFIKEAAQGEPTRKGATADGRAYAQWVKTIQSVEITFSVVRTTQDRLRYLVQGKAADGAKKALLTGIFVKKGPKTGGGRFHVNLTNVSDLYNAPGADGSVHFWFANHKGDKRGRRIAYINVVRRDDPQMQKVNYGADLVRLVGVGGRFRAVGVGDAIPDLPGQEAIGLRILWKAGEGGRAAAAVASLGPNPKLLGTAHECWDKDGLRTAYKDDNPNNDAMNPDEGTVEMCAGFAEEAPPDQADVSADGLDADPELDALLEESGSMDIDAAEADAADPIAP
ncbi:hypothetical protein [Polyangium sorediatum]|uniref:Lipoprotein n=1 Tax=Polyangium sorediatum TaxID=889274 RepID=A0ABT6NKT2_9BACT|nr:hypothetical protein [Polyangium sorediatum]MDI1428852.1 hypothetical protein [Polyangium sorediatum]